MLKRSLVMLALLTPAGVVHAQQGGWELDAREDWQRRVTVRLEIGPPDASGKYVVVRRAMRKTGEAAVFQGVGEKKGEVLRVRFRPWRGVRAHLEGGGKSQPVLGVYRFTGPRAVRGLLYDPGRVQGWTFTSERGRLVTAPPATRKTAPPFSPAGALPFKRIVICLDGIPYRVMMDLKKAGHFASFTQPARLISVWPSLSSISWGSILGLPAEPGYQAVYYANTLNKEMGVTLRKMKGSRFQSRMHHRHEGIIGHALAYVAPYAVGRRQLRKLIRELIHHEGSRTAFIYAYQTDPISHMNGRPKLERVLKEVDKELQRLQREFQKRHGEKLEIAIVSDHGHTLVSGELVKLDKFLEKHDWKVVKKIEKPTHASFTTAGILSSISLHCQEGSEETLARLVARMEGVELCTWDRGGRQQFVVSTEGVGRFDFEAATNSYRYRVVEGRDPIGYVAVYARLTEQGKVDRRGYAKSRDLFEATVDHAYPDAPARMRRGHTTLVRNPANVLVSLKDKYENGKGIVKLTARLRGRSGPHGGMTQHNSAGIFMTNYMPTVPPLRTRDFAKYVDLGDYAANGPPLEVSIAPSTETPKGAGAQPEYPVDLPREGMWVEANDRSTASRSPGVRTTLKVTVKRARFLLRNKTVWQGTFDGGQIRREKDTWVLPLRKAITKLKKGKTYKIYTRIEHRDLSGRLLHEEERKVKVRYRGTYQIYD